MPWPTTGTIWAAWSQEERQDDAQVVHRGRSTGRGRRLCRDHQGRPAAEDRAVSDAGSQGVTSPEAGIRAAPGTQKVLFLAPDDAPATRPAAGDPPTGVKDEKPEAIF